jgi:hypothetical protein
LILVALLIPAVRAKSFFTISSLFDWACSSFFVLADVRNQIEDPIKMEMDFDALNFACNGTDRYESF